MANAEHVRLLVTTTADEWNQWRKEHPDEIPDLSGVELAQEARRVTRRHGSDNLSLAGRNLQRASLVATDFQWVKIGDADFTSAELECAWFGRAIFGDGTPKGLGDVSGGKLENPSCDEHCRNRYPHSWYPNECARRCSEVLHADEKHVARLLEGAKAWNEWREAAPSIRPNLSGLDVHELFEKEMDIEKRDELDLTGINFEGAVLRGTQFHQVKLNGSTCRGADLRCSDWRGVDATEMNLKGADLRNASMSVVDLSDSNLESAETSGLKFDGVQLSRVVLRRVDLRDKKFGLSNLSGADLHEAHVCGSKFDEANLTGANLYGARIWRAKLFSTENITRTPDVESIVLPTIKDITAYLKGLFCIHRLASGTPSIPTTDLVTSVPAGGSYEVYYRGHGSDGWCLSPTVARCQRYTEREADLMSRLASRHPEEFREDSVYFQRLVRARHFDLPTRLLDVTSDPLTALYYATETTDQDADGLVHVFVFEPEIIYPFDSDTVSVVSNFARLSNDQQRTLLTIPGHYNSGLQTRTDKERDFTESRYRTDLKRLNHFIAREKPYWEDRIRPVDFFKVLLVNPASSFERLKAHRGAFLISAYHRDFDPATVNRKVPGAGRYSRIGLRIPHERKEPIRNQLRILGVTEEWLRADLGSTATAIAGEI